MSDYVIATTKSWNIENCESLKKRYPEERFHFIFKKEELEYQKIKSINPKYIFFPHWSWIIPKEIYENYDCVVFHMTDLPFGRGGSPLQNLIVRGIYNTKISAIKVDAGLDTGDVFFKEPIDIGEGSAGEILKRVSDIIFNRMLPKFIETDIKPTPQEGEVVSFSRRKPEESRIPDGLTQRQLYDYIRMLDGEGYPAAYMEDKEKKMYLRNARLVEDKVYADICIERKDS